MEEILSNIWNAPAESIIEFLSSVAVIYIAFVMVVIGGALAIIFRTFRKLNKYHKEFMDDMKF